MKAAFFFKLLLLSACLSLLYFGIAPGVSLMELLKLLAIGVVASVAVTVAYFEVRGVKAGDPVAVVADNAIPSIFGRQGFAAAGGRKNEQIRIKLGNGSEVTGIIESYPGIISPSKIRVVYEERLVE